LFAADAEADTTTVIEFSEAAAKTGGASANAPARQEPAERKKAVRILKDLPRELHIIDIPDAEKFCSCCGELHHFGDECSEQLGYVPASVRIIETRRKKYACKSCHGEVKRAKDDAQPPIAKSMASASLIAFLIVCKFADHLPLYRIAARLKRLGIELSHALMSDWLLQASELLEAVYERMVERVLASGHLFTDDTILPLQNDEPERRRTTIKGRLWVYACHHRRQKPLITYDFSRSRSQQAPYNS